MLLVYLISTASILLAHIFLKLSNQYQNGYQSGKKLQFSYTEKDLLKTITLHRNNLNIASIIIHQVSLACILIEGD